MMEKLSALNFDPEEIKIFSEMAYQRSKIYMLSSTFFLQRPDNEFLIKIKSNKFLQVVGSISENNKGEFRESFALIKEFLNKNENIPPDVLLNVLETDFTKLLRGIRKGYGPPPPYESVWRGEEHLWGKWTQKVLEFYLRTGIGMDLEDEVPDHIGIELKFMSLLCYREKENWKRKDVKDAFEVLNKERDFLDEYILMWVPRYLERMFSEAETDFYKGIANFTKNFMENDRKNIYQIQKIE